MNRLFHEENPHIMVILVAVTASARTLVKALMPNRMLSPYYSVVVVDGTVHLKFTMNASIPEQNHAYHQLLRLIRLNGPDDASGDSGSLRVTKPEPPYTPSGGASCPLPKGRRQVTVCAPPLPCPLLVEG